MRVPSCRLRKLICETVTAFYTQSTKLPSPAESELICWTMCIYVHRTVHVLLRYNSLTSVVNFVNLFVVLALNWN